MTIGMLVGNMEVSGGYQKLVIRLSQQLEKLGHRVTIYTPRVDLKNCYPKDISKLKVVSLPKDQANDTPAMVYKRLVPKMNKKLDALIIHDELSLIGVALLQPKPKKIIWMLNNQLPADIGKYHTEAKSVYKQTVGKLNVKAKETKKALDRVKLMRAGIKATTDFVTYDEFNKKLVEKKLHRPAVVVSAGADLDSFKKYAVSRLFKTKARYNLLSVGVLFPHRRYEDVIGALPYVKKMGLSVRVVIVGRQDLDPAYYQKLVKLVRSKAVEKEVIFKNFVSDEEMVELYKNSEAFLFINDGFTWGISVFEAVAAKLPVIITDNIGAADLIEPGKTGWVVTPRQPVQVAKAIQNILEHPDQTKLIVERAYQDLTEYVSWEAYTQRMLDIINH